MKLLLLSVISLMALTAAAPVSQAPVASDWKWEVTVDVFEGAIQGFFSSSDFPHLKTCANDTVEAYTKIDQAIGLIEQKTPESVKAGIEDLGAALTNLKDGLVECKAAEGDIENFVKVIEQFKSPLQFAYHVGKDLLVNGKDIYAEITTAVTDWKAESYRDAGVQIGTALNKLLVGEAKQVAMLGATSDHTWEWEVTVDVFEGALQGFFSTDQFHDLKACANDTVSAYDEIKSAIGLIEEKTPSSVEQGIKDLGAALTNLKDGLVECKAAEGEVESFVKVIEQFKSPLQFAYHVGKDLLVNGKDIYAEITTAVTDWKAESYRDAGVQIGTALNKLLVGEVQYA